MTHISSKPSFRPPSRTVAAIITKAEVKEADRQALMNAGLTQAVAQQVADKLSSEGVVLADHPALLEQVAKRVQESRFGRDIDTKDTSDPKRSGLISERDAFIARVVTEASEEFSQHHEQTERFGESLMQLAESALDLVGAGTRGSPVERFEAALNNARHTTPVFGSLRASLFSSTSAIAITRSVESSNALPSWDSLKRAAA